MRSHNGKYEFVMQPDGNLVNYGPEGVRWARGSTPGSWAIMQADGNFVLYTVTGAAVWATGTSGSGNQIILQNDGNLVVYSPKETPLWGCC